MNTKKRWRTETHEGLSPVTPRFARGVLRVRRDLEHCATFGVLEIPAHSQHDSPAKAGDVTGVDCSVK